MSSRNTPPGPAVDSTGQTTIDPSENVRALNAASVRRLDDMASHGTKAMRREIRAVRREVHIESRHIRQLMKAEAKRIDATRQVDVQAVAAAAGVQATGAATLQQQVSDTAEAQRQSQEAQRQATANALEQALEPIRKDVVALRESQWTGRGKEETQEKRSVSAGVWVGIGVGVLTLVGSTVLTFVSITVTVLIATGVFGGP